jgi:hypothetical protein
MSVMFSADARLQLLLLVSSTHLDCSCRTLYEQKLYDLIT